MALYWYDILGGIGSALIIGTYFLLQMDRLRANSTLYSFLNFLGATGIMVSLLFEFNLAAFIVELFWAAISLIGLKRHWKSVKLQPLK